MKAGGCKPKRIWKIVEMYFKSQEVKKLEFESGVKQPV